MLMYVFSWKLGFIFLGILCLTNLLFSFFTLFIFNFIKPLKSSSLFQIPKIKLISIYLFTFFNSNFFETFKTNPQTPAFDFHSHLFVYWAPFHPLYKKQTSSQQISIIITFKSHFLIF